MICGCLATKYMVAFLLCATYSKSGESFMNANIEILEPSNQPTQQCVIATPPAKNSVTLQSTLYRARRRLCICASAGLIIGIAVILCCIWIMCSSSQPLALAFGLFSILPFAIPTELIIMLLVHRLLSDFEQTRTKLGFYKQMPVEKLAFWSLIICFTPCFCTVVAIVLLILGVVS